MVALTLAAPVVLLEVDLPEVADLEVAAEVVVEEEVNLSTL